MLKPGLYEQIVNADLRSELAAIPAERKFLEKIDTAEASQIIAKYISAVVKKGLDNIADNGGELKEQIAFANQIVDLIERTTNDSYFKSLEIDPSSEILLALLKEHDPLLLTGGIRKLKRPETSIAKSSLFTGAASEPQLFSELKREISSADRFDMLVSFIKWSGLRLLIDDLADFTNRGGKLRVITTSYMGATDIKAIEALQALANTEIKISYNTKQTRLHAKAYVFYRETGFTTAYIGSSNVSNAALTSGLEWNNKITSTDQSETINKVLATFDYYWNDREFESYSNEQQDRLAIALKAEHYAENNAAALYTLDVRPYAFQQEILDKLLLERQLYNNYRNLLVAATGTGKTVISALDYKRYCQQNPHNSRRLLFVAHREEILTQSCNTFRAVLKDANFGDLLVGSHHPQSIEHLFISIQSFNSHNFWQNTAADYYDFIIVDEFHHAAAASYQKLLEYYQPKILLGLTATPERMDGKSVVSYFNNHISAEIRLPDAIDLKLLCPFQYFGVTDDTINLQKIRWHNGGYDKAELSYKLTAGIEAQSRADLVLNSMLKYIGDIAEVKGLGFCVSVENAKFMSDYFNSHKIPSIFLSANSPDELRLSAKDKLTAGKIKFIFVVDIYNEGVDIPAINTILFLRPTESLTIFLQQLGRGLRLCEGKDCLTVLDFIGQANQRYKFEDKFSALLSNTRRSLNKEIENDFISVPKGCFIHLEKIAAKYILDNIKESYGSALAIVKKLNYFESDSGQAKVSLTSFLDYYHIEPKLLYKFASFSRLCVRAKVRDDFNEELEEVLSKSFMRLAQIDSQRWLRFLIPFLKNLYLKKERALLDLNLDDSMQLRMLKMFYISIWGKAAKAWPDPEVSANFKLLSRSTVLLSELIELLEYKLAKIDFLDEHEDLGFDCPLDLYCSYTRDQLFTALDYDKPQIIREGVKWLPDKKIDVLLVTLNKSDKDYSPSTLYDDYSINEKLFHWQSQSTTSENSATGQRYIHHKEWGSKILLFVRNFKNDRQLPMLAMNYTYLGCAEYVSHEGSRPMSIVWKLKKSIPAKFLKITNKLVIG